MTGPELRQIRDELGLTQQELAIALGVAVPTISRWETGSRKIPGLLRLALAQITAESKPTPINQI